MFTESDPGSVPCDLSAQILTPKQPDLEAARAGQLPRKGSRGRAPPHLVQVDDEGVLAEVFVHLVLRDVSVHAGGQLGKDR